MKKEVIILTFMFLIFSLVLTIFAVSGVHASVYINEVMPNPIDNCSDCTEWLELYSNVNQNLADWKLNTGESKNLTINATIQDYLIITKNKTVFLEFWNIPSEKVIELAIGLTNSKDSITLYNPENETIDYFNWSKDIGNSSWAHIDNGTFLACTPTPASNNNCQTPEQEQNQTQNNSQDNSNDSSKEQESSIDIKDYPGQAKFGEKITLDLRIYRGNTAKYAVYAYVQDENEERVSDKKTIHIDQRYDTYRDEIKLTLNCLNESGTYKIVVQGLDERDTAPIDISSCSESVSNSQPDIINNTQNEVIPTYQYIPPAITGQATSQKPQTLKSSSLSFLDVLPYIMLIIIAILVIYFIVKK
jgi:hypothetical protein